MKSSKFLKSKRGNLDTGLKVAFGIIGVVITLIIVATLYPTAASAGDDLQNSGIPLGTLFGGGGVLFLVLAAGLIGGMFVLIRNITK